MDVHKEGEVIDTVDLGAKRWYLIGRDSAQADLVFEHSTISRRHAAIAHGVASGDPADAKRYALSVIDLDSTFGTFVGSSADTLEKIRGSTPTPLRIGDVVRFGESTRLYHIVSAAKSGGGSGGRCGDRPVWLDGDGKEQLQHQPPSSKRAPPAPAAAQERRGAGGRRGGGGSSSSTPSLVGNGAHGRHRTGSVTEQPRGGVGGVAARIFAGNRVRLRSGLEGLVLHVGGRGSERELRAALGLGGGSPARNRARRGGGGGAIAGDEADGAVLGLQLAEDQITRSSHAGDARGLLGAGCDGSVGGQRYFRCAAGFGAFAPLGEVADVLPPQPPTAHQGVAAYGAGARRGSGGGGGVAACGRRKSAGERSEPFELERELARVVGLDAVKAQLRSVRNRLEVNRRREALGVKDTKPLHAKFVGSAGCDFEQVARILAAVMREAGVLPTRKVTVLGREALVGANTDATLKLVKQAVDKAAGGLMLVRDARQFKNKDSGSSNWADHYGQLALQALGEEIGAHDAAVAEGGSEAPRPLVLVLAGQREDVAGALAAAPPLAPRLGTTLEFAEYGIADMAALLRQRVEAEGFHLDPALTDEKLQALLRPRVGRAGAASGGLLLLKEMVEAAKHCQTDRVYEAGDSSRDSLLRLTERDFHVERGMSGGAGAAGGGSGAASANGGAGGHLTPQSVLAELDSIVGLDSVKRHMHSLKAQLLMDKKRRAAGMGSGASPTLHMIFTGNPGTGKTSVARIVAELMRALGYLRRGHVVEIDRAGLVGGYCGQTAIKTTEVVESALGGVLFVDEAYTLVSDSKDSFGREALDTLMKLVEDHREDLVVVLAGYPAEMDELLAHNPGVRSRFPTTIHFDDYTVSELMQIAQKDLKKQSLCLAPDAKKALEERFEHLVALPGRENGNGRAVRNIIESAVRAQSVRLAADMGQSLKGEQLSLITGEDVRR